MSRVLTFIRHGAAVVAAWLVATLSGLFGIEPDPETTSQVADGLAVVGVALFTLAYAWGEKALKPLFGWFGEVQPGEADRP